MTLRIKLKENQHLTLVSVYAPTKTNDDSIKEQLYMYEDLDKVIRDVPTNDKLVIVGDSNARVESNSTNWKGVLSPHGVEKENSNGMLLLDKCAQH